MYKIILRSIFFTDFFSIIIKFYSEPFFILTHVETKNVSFRGSPSYKHLEGVFEYSGSFSSVFFLILNGIYKYMFWYVSEHANIRKHVSEYSWSSGWVILSILAHLAHLAQSYFSLIFSAINTYNCSWFNLTNKKICSDWR